MVSASSHHNILDLLFASLEEDSARALQHALDTVRNPTSHVCIMTERLVIVGHRYYLQIKEINSWDQNWNPVALFNSLGATFQQMGANMCGTSFSIEGPWTDHYHYALAGGPISAESSSPSSDGSPNMAYRKSSRRGLLNLSGSNLSHKNSLMTSSSSTLIS
jgi:hypothetical protein